MNRTGIEYLDYTWNPTVGCSPVSSGCRSCWARIMSHRLKAMGQKDYQIDDPFKPRLLTHRFHDPMTVKKPARIGVSFMGDLFHGEMKKGNFTWKPWERIYHIFYIMMQEKQHTYLVLTKRPDNMLEFMDMWMKPNDDISNIHFGVSVEDQKTADERIPILLQIPAAVRWVSYEPALEGVDFDNTCTDRSCWREGIDWIVMGAETGHKARPFDFIFIKWARFTRFQCWNAKIPFFFKSAGKLKTPDDLMVREYPK